MEDSLNLAVLKAKQNEAERENFIKENKQTILRAASSAAHRYVTESDDEWSVVLYAFSRAIDAYETGKGDFLPFARTLMRNSLIDYYRLQAKYAQEISVAPEIMEGNSEEVEEDPVYLAVARKSRQVGDTSLHDEILAANEMFSSFGFSFYDLTECSPKQEKTRRECINAVKYLLNSSGSCLSLMNSGKLPIREIKKNTGTSVKTIDRYRKYIIAVVIILREDFPHLADYLKPFREEGA